MKTKTNVSREGGNHEGVRALFTDVRQENDHLTEVVQTEPIIVFVLRGSDSHTFCFYVGHSLPRQKKKSVKPLTPRNEQ